MQLSAFGNCHVVPSIDIPVYSSASNEMPSVHADVIIIGAGFSGLVAAYNIRKNSPDLKVLLLEEKTRLDSEHFKFIVSSLENDDQLHLLKLCKELGVPLKEHFVLGNTVIKKWHSHFKLTSILAKYEFRQFLKYVETITKSLKPEGENSDIPNINMCDFIGSRLFFSQSKQIANILVKHICNTMPEEVNLIEFLMLCNNMNGLTSQYKKLTQSKPVYSLGCTPEEFLNKMQHKIGASRIRYGNGVRQIWHYTDRVVMQTSSMKRYEAHMIVVALPWQDIKKITFSPSIPMQYCTKTITSIGSVITTFESQHIKSYWRRQGLSNLVVSHKPQMVCYETGPYSIVGAVFHDDSVPQPNDMKSVVMHRMRKEFGNGMDDPMVWKEIHWENEAIISVPPVNPWNRICWTTSIYEPLCRTYMNRAIEGGTRAALNVLVTLNPDTISWEDVKEYLNVDKDTETEAKQRKSKGFLRSTFSLGTGLKMLSIIASLTILLKFGGIIIRQNC